MFIAVIFQSLDTNCGGRSELVCREKLGRVVNTNLCLFPDYNKFELPIKNGVNIIDIGIDITDVLRINDKASYIECPPGSCLYEIFQEYGIQFSSYFNVMWREPRLYIPARILGNSSSDNRLRTEECPDAEADSDEALIPVNLELVNLLWLPNIFVYNLKTFKVVTLHP